ELEPPPILGIRPEVNPQLAAIIMRSLRKSPDDRYQSADEFLEALRDYEQNHAEREQTLRSPSVRPTQPQTEPLTMQAIKSTLMDESATLLAPRAQDESLSTRKPHLEDQVTIPLKSDVSSPAAAAAAAPDPAGAEIGPRLNTGRRGRKLPLALSGAGLLLAGTAAGAIFFSQQKPPAPAPPAEAAKVLTTSPTPAPSSAPASSPVARVTV